MKLKSLIWSLLFVLTSIGVYAQKTRSDNYQHIQSELQKGWGTFNSESVLSHVFLPYGLSLKLGIKYKGITSNGYLSESYISSRDLREESIIPGNHALDGSYTDLEVTWKNLKFRVQSATTENGDLYLLVSPLMDTTEVANLILEVGMLWNKPGIIQKTNNQINAILANRVFTINTVGSTQVSEYIPTTSSYLAVQFGKETAFYTGEKRSLQDIKNFIAQKAKNLEIEFAKYKSLSSTYGAMQNVIAWNTIYDASENRIINPVSRLWIKTFGGQSLLFCWDTYFAAYMASLGSKNLAYANAIEMTKSITANGFVPNWAGSYDNASFDRSQPPVGSMVIKELYRKFNDKWLLEDLFDDLLKWNRWWPNERDNNGMLCWGSNYYPNKPMDFAANNWQGAAYESGLDNSPMFDDVPFNSKTNLMEQADVGLMSLYIMDCDALADIAKVLNKKSEAKELAARATKYRNNLNNLWNNNTGIYMNMRTDNKEYSKRLSPTNFYPLLANAPTQKQAKRMIDEHLLNPEEFNGKFVIPSIAMNDEAFKEQEYWRGRIWAPMNFLVYAGLLNYDLPEAKKVIAQKSNHLLLVNINKNNWVYENYNALTGNVGDIAEAKSHGDNYYHWGALLGFIALIDEGYVENPLKPLK